jgi:hypothetical protein
VVKSVMSRAFRSVGIGSTFIIKRRKDGKGNLRIRGSKGNHTPNLKAVGLRKYQIRPLGSSNNISTCNTERKACAYRSVRSCPGSIGSNE